MDVFPVLHEILLVANAVIGETALPYFSFPSNLRAECVRVSAFDELNRAFKAYIECRSEQQVYMLGHYDKRVQLKFTRSPVSVDNL